MLPERDLLQVLSVTLPKIQIPGVYFTGRFTASVQLYASIDFPIFFNPELVSVTQWRTSRLKQVNI
jgi:hypothetical protein